MRNSHLSDADIMAILMHSAKYDSKGTVRFFCKHRGISEYMYHKIARLNVSHLELIRIKRLIALMCGVVEVYSSKFEYGDMKE